MLLKRVHKTAFTFLKELWQRDSVDSAESSNTNPVCYSCVSQASMWLKTRHVIRKTINDDNQLCVLCYCLFHQMQLDEVDAKNCVDRRGNLLIFAQQGKVWVWELNTLQARSSLIICLAHRHVHTPVALHLKNLKLGFRQFGDAVRVICHTEERRRCTGEKERNMQGKRRRVDNV